jgi:mannose-6-phosphate isomerase-like protein (cupin superfamily)
MADFPTDTYYIAGNLVRFLERSPDAGYCLVEALVEPGAGAPLNAHSADDEAFLILEGTFEFGVGAEILHAKRSAFVKIPLGEVHTFRNFGSAPGRMLIINSSGALHVNFFSQAGVPMPEGTRALPSFSHPPDIERLLAAGRANGMTFPAFDVPPQT